MDEDEGQWEWEGDGNMNGGLGKQDTLACPGGVVAAVAAAAVAAAAVGAPRQRQQRTPHGTVAEALPFAQTRGAGTGVGCRQLSSRGDGALSKGRYQWEGKHRAASTSRVSLQWGGDPPEQQTSSLPHSLASWPLVFL